MSYCVWPRRLRLPGLLSVTTESRTARTVPKPKVYRMWNDYFRPKPNVYRKSAHFPTFGADTKKTKLKFGRPLPQLGLTFKKLEDHENGENEHDELTFAK